MHEIKFLSPNWGELVPLIVHRCVPAAWTVDTITCALYTSHTLQLIYKRWINEYVRWMREEMTYNITPTCRGKMSIASASNNFFVFQIFSKWKFWASKWSGWYILRHIISNEEHIHLDYYDYQYLKVAYCPYFPEPIPTVQCWAGAGVHVSKPIPRWLPPSIRH